MRKQLTAVMLVGLLGLAGTALTAQAVRFAPQIDFGTNNYNFGIGGRLDLGLAKTFGAPIDGVGSFDYFFGTSGVHIWEINANLFYNFTVPKSNITRTRVAAWTSVPSPARWPDAHRPKSA